MPDGASGWHGKVFAPLPSPPTIVTGPHAPSGVVPGEPMSPGTESFEPRPSPTAESTHARTLFAPSGTHVVGTPDMPCVRIEPGNAMSSP